MQKKKLNISSLDLVHKAKLEKRDKKENYFLDATGVSADNVLPNGMTPRGIGEFRSYLQLPYIYWNKLFQIFTKKTKEITGYDCILNQDFCLISKVYAKII